MDNLKQRGGRRGEKGKEREGQKGRKRKALPRHSSEQLVDLADGRECRMVAFEVAGARQEKKMAGRKRAGCRQDARSRKG